MIITEKLLKVQNFAKGRQGPYPIDLVVIHVTEGDAGSVISWFNNPAAEVSSHYLVKRDGEIIQFVAEADTAWHAGRIDSPTAELVIQRGQANPNWYSIGIEHEGDGTQDLLGAQFTASAALVKDVCKRNGIPVDRRHIVGHREIYSLKPCPGAINVDRLVQAVGSVSPILRERPKIVWSGYHRDWLLVTDERSDTEWYFVPMKQLKALPATRGTTPLSKMPLEPR